MARPATCIELTETERAQLENWIRQPKTQSRYAERARIILWAADGLSNQAIAEPLDTRCARISKWRIRFDQERLAGLADDFRPGRIPVYDETTRQRLLAQLDQEPPKGHAHWTGPLLAKALGDISTHQIGRELRALGISLARRRSWCVSTDPEFAQKAADIVGLYLSPPNNALVFAVDEKPCIQALARQQGWLRLPNGQALSGFQHDYNSLPGWRHASGVASIQNLTGIACPRRDFCHTDPHWWPMWRNWQTR